MDPEEFRCFCPTDELIFFANALYLAYFSVNYDLKKHTYCSKFDLKVIKTV